MRSCASVRGRIETRRHGDAEEVLRSKIEGLSKVEVLSLKRLALIKPSTLNLQPLLRASVFQSSPVIREST
jgi:hypothetical protein